LQGEEKSFIKNKKGDLTMKKRLHDKLAGIVILAVLMVLSAVEIVFRYRSVREVMTFTANYGEPFAVFLFAGLLLTFTLMGKDRVCYICFGAWIGCFVLDQIIGLPGVAFDLAHIFKDGNPNETLAVVNIALRIVTMLSIIGIGALLVEYLNDGTICNTAFNTLCIIAVVTLLANVGLSLYSALKIVKHLMLIGFNSIYMLIMVFLTTFFAYDAAKKQLKKTDLTK
jgi:hypothetical protein